MKQKILATIGICVRNGEATITETLDSLIKQDYPSELMEVIIVDGYSTDNTLSIIAAYLEKKGIEMRIFFEGNGLGWARQIVVDHAKGDYVVWIDADMTFPKDFVKRQISFMKKNANVGIAKGQYELKSGANLLSTLEICSRAADKMVDFSKDKARSKALGTSGCIYRLRAIRQVGGFDKQIKGYGEDWDAEYRIRLAGWKLCTIPVPYSDYERFGITWQDLWRRYRRRGFDLYDVFKKHRGVVKLYAMIPFMAFFLGIFKSMSLYKLTRKRLVFLLPIQHLFKMTSWWSGYINRVLDL